MFEELILDLQAAQKVYKNFLISFLFVKELLLAREITQTRSHKQAHARTYKLMRIDERYTYIEIFKLYFSNW